MSGGGFVESAPHEPSSKRPKPSSNPSRNGLLLALTPKQEDRLCAHLDDRLLGLKRDERKQAFHSIPILLDRLYPLLHLILQIPPRAPWHELRISYLLNLTGFLGTYITSLPLLPPGSVRDKGKEAENAAGKVMADVLAFLDEVERGWIVVLGGQGWVMDDNESSGEGRRSGHGVQVDFTGSVGQTERASTRLRSIIISSRAKFTAWARTYGSFSGSTLSSAHNETPRENGSRRTMGCEGADGFDPDPPTTYSASSTTDITPTSNETAGIGSWEDRILGMWNTILETLTDQDLGQDRGR